MITPDDVLDALSKAAAYDNQHCPKPHSILVSAWVEHFERFASAVTRDDLLEAVTEYHREPHDRMLQPADLSSIARALRRDRFERSDIDSPERLELEARIEAKAQPRELEPDRDTALAKHVERLNRVIAQFDPKDADDAKSIRFLRNLTDSPLRVDCPWCKATVGNPCVIPKTVPPQPLRKVRAHPSRIEACRA